MCDEIEVLAGGVGNAGLVVRIGDRVLRPTSAHTPGIHALLGFLHDVGFDAVPQVVDIEADGRERLVFIPGDVPIPPFPAWSTTDAYGLDSEQRGELLDILDDRMANAGGFVRRHVEAGEQAFIAMWNAMGGQERYDRRHDWFVANRATFEAQLTG